MPEGRFVFKDGELIDTQAGVKRQIDCNKFAEFVTKEYGLRVPRATLYAVCVNYNVGNNMLFAGDPGVGKTMMIKALAEYTGIYRKPIRNERGELVENPDNGYIRVQMYPGITYVEFIGDWDYPRQLVAVEALRGGIKVSPENIDEVERALEKISQIVYNPERMFRAGPAVRALEKAKTGSILHVDELNRGSEESQALLFEITGEKQVTHPSGKVFRSTDEYTSSGEKADWKVTFPQYPMIIATINEGDVATVELSNALLRRFVRIPFLRPGVKEILDVVSERAGSRIQSAERRLKDVFHRA